MRRGRWTCVALLAALALPAAVPRLATPWPAGDQDLLAANRPPSLAGGGGAAPHLLGTDDLGRDLLARILAGGRTSLGLSGGAAAVALLLGVLLGIPAGVLGGRADRALTGLADVLYGLPHLLFVLFLVALAGAKAPVILGTLGLFQGLTLSRILRLESRSIAQRPYVEAARALGASTGRVILRHILPNLRGVLLTYGLLSLPALLLQESFLGFLGFSPAEATLGGLMKQGQETLAVYPWQILFPGLYLTLFLGTLTILGEGMRTPNRR